MHTDWTMAAWLLLFVFLCAVSLWCPALIKHTVNTQWYRDTGPLLPSPGSRYSHLKNKNQMTFGSAGWHHQNFLQAVWVIICCNKTLQQLKVNQEITPLWLQQFEPGFGLVSELVLDWIETWMLHWFWFGPTSLAFKMGVYWRYSALLGQVAA